MKTQKHKFELDETSLSIDIDNSTEFKDFIIESSVRDKTKTVMIQLSSEGIDIEGVKIPNHLKPILIEFLSQEVVD